MSKKREGFAYIIVIVIITISTSIITMLYVNTKTSIETVEIYSEYSNNYSMAVSGVEKLESELNFYLYQNIDYLLLKTDEYVSRQNLNNILFLEDNQFNFKMKNSAYQTGEKNTYYKNILFIYFYSMFSSNYNNSFSYTLKNELDEYLVTVNYVLQNYSIIVFSKAENLTNGTNTEVFAIINFEEGYEKATPTFKWINTTTPFLYGVTCSELIIDKDSILAGDILQNYVTNFDYLSDESDDNVIINSNIDIDELEDEYYIIFSKSDLTITNSGIKNFKGVIVSLGDINFIDCNTNIEGNIIAKNNIYLINSNINAHKDSNAIFKVNCKNNKLYYNVLDSLKITNFKNADNVVDTSSGIQSALNNVQFDKIKSSEIKKLQFKASQLMKK